MSCDFQPSPSRSRKCREELDLVLVDFDREVTLSDEGLYTKVGWIPYVGWKVLGYVELTMLRGTVIARDRQILRPARLWAVHPTSMDVVSRRALPASERRISNGPACRRTADAESSRRSSAGRSSVNAAVLVAVVEEDFVSDDGMTAESPQLSLCGASP